MVALSETAPRSPAGTRLLVALAGEHGVDAAVVLAGTGLDAAVLAEPDAVLDHRQELRALANAVRALGDPPGLGAQLGRRFSLANHGDLGFAVMTQATAREGLAVAVRFFGLSDALVGMRPRAEDDGDAVLELDASGVPPELRAFVVERDVGVMTAVVDQALPGAALEVTLTLDRARVAAVRRCAPGHVVAAGPVDAVRVPAAALERPMPNADVSAARRFVERLEEQVRRVAAGGALAPRVQRALVAALPVRRTAPQVAAELHVAPRTLRRRLQAEGTSFQALADAVLADHAQALLREGLPVALVAERLGYAETAAFTRAFRRWTGSSPRAWARHTAGV
ncbi:AraC family transcriptional regulator [Conexibacter sp. SYSU D00693]|uniref:AraC family transcriptional regulator n=1 Tax=Conexibacter sp. SYSU D00693 TaxID=2812560 RepID=UPI00196B00E8|nr:AraC family transcriptional regulator [Conexibacter sp. SYSU D00693]